MRVLPTVSDWVLGRRVYRRFASRPGAGHIATSRALACLAAIVRRHRPKEVVEFGAGIGTITFLLLSASPETKVVAVEANPFCLDQMAKNIPDELKPRLTLTTVNDPQLDRRFDLIVIDGDYESNRKRAFLLPDTICFIEGNREHQADLLRAMAAEKGLSIDLDPQFPWMRRLHWYKTRLPLVWAPSIRRSNSCKIGMLTRERSAFSPAE